jgi:hypothetical protein
MARRDVLQDWDGTLAHERDRHRVGAKAVARTQRAACEALKRVDCYEAVLFDMGFSKRTLLLEQRGPSLSDQDIGTVAELLGLFHEALHRLPHPLRPESDFRGQHRAAEEMCADGFGES